MAFGIRADGVRVECCKRRGRYLNAHNGVTRTEIEKAILNCAALVDRYGDSMMPMLDRLEADYTKLRRPPEVERVKKMIDEARLEDGLA